MDAKHQNIGSRLSPTSPKFGHGQDWQDNKMFVMGKVDNKRPGVGTSTKSVHKNISDIEENFKKLISTTGVRFYLEDQLVVTLVV